MRERQISSVWSHKQHPRARVCICISNWVLVCVLNVALAILWVCNTSLTKTPDRSNMLFGTNATFGFINFFICKASTITHNKWQEVRTTDDSRPLHPHSRLFKIIDFCRNWKHIYDFLLVIKCHLSSISHHFQDTASQSRKPPHSTLSPQTKRPPSNFGHWATV